MITVIMSVEIQVLSDYILLHGTAAMLSDGTSCGCSSYKGLRQQVARACK